MTRRRRHGVRLMYTGPNGGKWIPLTGPFGWYGRLRMWLDRRLSRTR